MAIVTRGIKKALQSLYFSIWRPLKVTRTVSTFGGALGPSVDDLHECVYSWAPGSRDIFSSIASAAETEHFRAALVDDFAASIPAGGRTLRRFQDVIEDLQVRASRPGFGAWLESDQPVSPKEIAESPPHRRFCYPEREDITIYGVLAALSDPTRLQIVRTLAKSPEACPFEFLDITSKQDLAHHFKVLHEAGLVQARYEGRNKFVWLRRELIDDMFPGLLDGLLHAVEAADPR